MSTATNPIAAAVAPVVDAIAAQIPKLEQEQNWYAIAAASGEEAEVMIYDIIGAFGVTARRFVSDLNAITAKTINIRINSRGGDVDDATAIYNAIKTHPARVITHIDGFAASSGSFIAIAGDEVRMADNAYMIIHEAHGMAMGEAGDMRKYADTLEMMNENIANMYQKKAGKTRKYWRGKMAAESWFNADEAKAEGLIDKVVAATKKPEPARAGFDFKIYNKIPDPVKALWGIQETVKPAPEHSRESEPAQAITKETQPMAETSNIVAPAQTPAAGSSVSQGNSQSEVERIREMTTQGWIEHGRKLGAAESREAELKRMRDIVEACPGNTDLAIQAFLSGQTVTTVRIAFEAAAKEKAISQAAQAQKDVEIARLQAALAIGGHVGVAMVPMGQNIGVIVPPETDPEAQAKMEWDGDPSIHGKCSEKQWMLFRVNQLKGSVRALSRQVA